MTIEDQAAFILRDDEGAYYAIPLAALAHFRVPAEDAPALERAIDEASGDTAGFAQGQGNGQGRGQGQGHAHGRGHGSGNPHNLTPAFPGLLPLPFPIGTITDGTSNTIVFGER